MALGVALMVWTRRGVRGEREETERRVKELDNTYVNWEKKILRKSPLNGHRGKHITKI